MNQATLPMLDYEASCAFYRRLGLIQIVAAPPHYARFECPPTDGVEPATVSIEAVEGPIVLGALIHFEVDDVDAVIADLRAGGVKVLSEPESKSWLWREADIADPAGNRLRLYHAGTARRFPPWRLSAERDDQREVSADGG